MLGKYKAVLALLLLIILVPLTLLMTLGLWDSHAGGHLATARDTYCIR